jgi:predicted ATP-grasp superfamily ATP-dependent carboligase
VSTKDTKILVAFAEALAAPEVVWSLRDDGFDVTVANRRGRRTALHHSRAVSIVDVTPPEENLAACVEELAREARTRGATLMPVDDAGVAVCARIRVLHDGQLIIGPTGPQAELALDKRRQLDAASAAGFLVPPTRIVHTRAELRDADLSFPVVLKATQAVRVDEGRLVRGRGFVCADREELTAAEAAWDERYALFVQPLLVGVGEGVFGLRGTGEDLLLSAHHRIRMMNPQGSGSSACETTPVDPELAAAAGRFLHDADWRGVFMLEFLRDVQGQAWFMELNGRSWGSMALALRAGLDYPAWAARTTLSPAFRATMPTDHPHIVCRHLGREIVHFLFAVRGPKTSASSEWPRPVPTLAKLLTLRRGDRWYNWRRDDWRVFFADTVNTVMDQARGRGA